MLDQNTDRTYWVIGAVIIVALLIAAAKIAFPEVFNSVMDFFKSELANGKKAEQGIPLLTLVPLYFRGAKAKFLHA